MEKRRIFIVEDHPLFRAGLIHMLKTDSAMDICGEVSSRAEALDYLSQSELPDIILLDLSLKDTNGLELLKDIRYSYPDIPVLVVSMHDEQYYAERALHAGAKGYIMKQEASENILRAVNDVLNGQIYISKSIEKKVMETSSMLSTSGDLISQLSDREFEIFEMISRGIGTKSIADNLNLSVKTIETHNQHIKEKLHIKLTPELRQFAIEWRSSNGKK